MPLKPSKDVTHSTQAKPDRIQLPDFFDRIEFLLSLGFSLSLLPSMIDPLCGPEFLHLTDSDPSQPAGDQHVPKHEEPLRWLIRDEPSQSLVCGLGLGAGVVHNTCSSPMAVV